MADGKKKKIISESAVNKIAGTIFYVWASRLKVQLYEPFIKKVLNCNKKSTISNLFKIYIANSSTSIY